MVSTRASAHADPEAWFELDFVARAADGALVLVGEVKADGDGGIAVAEQVAGILRHAGLDVPFVLFADRATIRIHRWDGSHLSAPVFEAPAADILSAYDPEFARKRVFDHYLIVLVEAWLRDVAYHWKHERPPGMAGLEAAGVAARLAGGTTEREVRASARRAV